MLSAFSSFEEDDGKFQPIGQHDRELADVKTAFSIRFGNGFFTFQEDELICALALRFLYFFCS